MTRRYLANSLYMCTVLIVSLATTTSALNLEELNLKVQRIEQNYIEMKQEFELKIQHLETTLIDQQNEYRTLLHNVAQSATKENANSISKQVEQRSSIFRTCKELHQDDPSLNSGMYWIDPDGQGVGDDPIYVECDMATGKTSIPHDSENATNVGHCADPGCYTRPIIYSASARQMEALAELSSECHQSIRYDCNYAPFEINGVPHAWWNDRNDVAQYFWSGSNNSLHTCQCGIDHNCLETYNFCNCDSTVPVPLYDSGVITDKMYLPIIRLNFGRTQLESSSGVHTLGKFECSGQVNVAGMPKSCSDLWKIGHTLSGIYSIMGTEYVETVYCNFAMLPHEQDFQTLIGYADVKSSPVYFYVQKNASQSVTGIVPYEFTMLNIGGAMNPSSGIFTAHRNGIYSFHFSGVAYYPSTSAREVHLSLVLNGDEIGRSITGASDDYSYYTISLHSTLELKTSDQVWTNVSYLSSGASLYEDGIHRSTHFTGYLLQENVASSLNLKNSLSDNYY